MDKGSTLYDYTRSAEELRVFELGETCSRIIHKYEMFNLQNDVYKMFGEWLLNEAKTGYSAVFTSKDLNRFLGTRIVDVPDSVTIKAKKEDYDSCEKLRMLSCGCYWNYKCGYESSYAWYTLWKIAKAYNKQNGCIVMDAPRHEDGCVKIFLDWSKEAQDCISHEKWMAEAEKDNGIGWYLVGGACAGLILGFLAYVVLALVGLGGRFAFLTMVVLLPFVCSVLLATCFRKEIIKRNLDKLSKNFITHCERIEETRYSRYSIRLDEQRDWEGNWTGWF